MPIKIVVPVLAVMAVILMVVGATMMIIRKRKEKDERFLYEK